MERNRSEPAAALPPLTPKARRTRAALVSAARAIIGRHGASGVSVVAVCDLAGVGRTSFYTYFDDVGALIDSVAHSAGQAIKDSFDAAHADLPRGLDRLETCLETVLQTAATDPETGLLITALAQHDSAFLDLLLGEIGTELRAARDTGQLAPDPGRAAALAQFLAISVLALARAFALGRLGRDAVPGQVALLMSACPAP